MPVRRMKCEGISGVHKSSPEEKDDCELSRVDDEGNESKKLMKAENSPGSENKSAQEDRPEFEIMMPESECDSYEEVQEQGKMLSMYADDFNLRKNFGFIENGRIVWKGSFCTKLALAIGFATSMGVAGFYVHNLRSSKNNTTDVQSTDDISPSPSDAQFSNNVSENPSSKVDGSDGMTPSTKTEENQNDNLANSDNVTINTTDDGEPEIPEELPANPQNSDVPPAVSRQTRGADITEIINENIHKHIQFKDYDTDQKMEVFYFGIIFALLEVSKDKNLPVAIRERAKQGISGARVLRPVDINKHLLKYTFLLTDADNSKTGIIIFLNQNDLYADISTGFFPYHRLQSNMPPGIVEMQCLPNSLSGLGSHCINMARGNPLKEIAYGGVTFSHYFNLNEPNKIDVYGLSERLTKDIEDHPDNIAQESCNTLLMQRALKGEGIVLSSGAWPSDYLFRKSWAQEEFDELSKRLLDEFLPQSLKVSIDEVIQVSMSDNIRLASDVYFKKTNYAASRRRVLQGVNDDRHYCHFDLEQQRGIYHYALVKKLYDIYNNGKSPINIKKSARGAITGARTLFPFSIGSLRFNNIFFISDQPGEKTGWIVNLGDAGSPGCYVRDKSDIPPEYFNNLVGERFVCDKNYVMHAASKVPYGLRLQTTSISRSEVIQRLTWGIYNFETILSASSYAMTIPEMSERMIEDYSERYEDELDASHNKAVIAAAVLSPDENEFASSEPGETIKAENYTSLSENHRHEIYKQEITRALNNVAEDEKLPVLSRVNARKVLSGFPGLVTVILGSRSRRKTLYNTVFLPDEAEAKSGVIIKLDLQEDNYCYIEEIKNIPISFYEGIVDLSGTKGHPYAYAASTTYGVYIPQLFNGTNDFNFDKPVPLTMNDIAERLDIDIDQRYENYPGVDHNKALFEKAAITQFPVSTRGHRPVRLAQLINTGMSDTTRFFREFQTLGSFVFSEMNAAIAYSRSMSHKEALKKYKKHIAIQSIVDTVRDVSISFIPGVGLVIGTMQSAANIAAKVSNDETLTKTDIAGPVLAIIPVKKISGVLGKVSQAGAKAFTMLHQVASKMVDVVELNEAIEVAVRTGDFSSIFNACVAAGFSSADSLSMAKSIFKHRSEFETGKPEPTDKDLNSAPQAKPGEKNPGYSKGDISRYTYNSRMPDSIPQERDYKFKIGNTEYTGRMHPGGAIMTLDGRTWTRCAPYQRFALAMQNAGGRLSLPQEGGRQGASPQYDSSTITPDKMAIFSSELLRVESNSKTAGKNTGVMAFSYFGNTRYGKLEDGIFSVSENGVNGWVQGNWLSRMVCYMANQQTIRDSLSQRMPVAVLDKKIVDASREGENREYSSICYTAAFNDARQAYVINDRTLHWLKETIVKPDTAGNILNSQKYKDAFNLQGSKQLKDFNEMRATESGFVHIGKVLPGGKTEFNHVIYMHKDGDKFYFYQSNPGALIVAMSGSRPLESFRNIGGYDLKQHYRHEMDSNTISLFNDYFAQQKEGVEEFFVFTPASEVNSNYKNYKESPEKVSGLLARTDTQLIEPVLKSRPYLALSQGETALIKETTKHLQDKLGRQYNTFIMRPKGKCASAVAEVAKVLRQSGYEDIKIEELGIWPNGGPDTRPSNHYIVMARKDGTDIVVDLTAGQFEQYGFSAPIISTKDNWIYQWQQKLKDKPRTLIKMAPLSGGISTSPFSMEYVDSQKVVPGGTVLHRANWYKSANVPAENAQPILWMRTDGRLHKVPVDSLVCHTGRRGRRSICTTAKNYQPTLELGMASMARPDKNINDWESGSRIFSSDLIDQNVKILFSLDNALSFQKDPSGMAKDSYLKNVLKLDGIDYVIDQRNAIEDGYSFAADADFTQPGPAQKQVGQLTRLVFQINSARKDNPGKVVAVHCGAGDGRSGTVKSAVMIEKLLSEHPELYSQDVADGNKQQASIRTDLSENLNDYSTVFNPCYKVVAAAVNAVRTTHLHAVERESDVNLLNAYARDLVNKRSTQVG